jgi:hypothetical protein
VAGPSRVRSQPTTTNVSQRLDPQVRRGPEAGPQGARNPAQVLVLLVRRRGVLPGRRGAVRCDRSPCRGRHGRRGETGAGRPCRAMAARVAPVGGIAAESMRQATRRAEQRAARLPAKARRSSRIGAARQMIAAEGLATVDGMIARCRGGGRPAPDYEIARLTVALRDLRVRDDAWAPDGSRARRRAPAAVDRPDLPRTAGHLAAPAALLALASSRQHQVMARVVIRPAQGRRPPRTSTCCRGVTRSSGWRWWRAQCTPRGCRPAMTWPRCRASGWRRMRKRARAELEEIRLRQRAVSERLIGTGPNRRADGCGRCASLAVAGLAARC